MDARIDLDETGKNYDGTKESFKLIYKYTPRTVNLCPYCRAIVGAVTTLPFLYVYRLFPHTKNKKPMTIEQIRKNSRRRTWISIGFASSINFAFGLMSLVRGGDGSLIIGPIQCGVGAAILTAVWWGPAFFKVYLRLTKLIPKRAPKPPKQKVHTPSKFKMKISKKHEAICPPIFFVDVKEAGQLT